MTREGGRRRRHRLADRCREDRHRASIADTSLRRGSAGAARARTAPRHVVGMHAGARAGRRPRRRAGRGASRPRRRRPRRRARPSPARSGLAHGALEVEAAGREHHAAAVPRAATASQVVANERSRARPSTSSPPASSTISGTQCPAANGGSSHSATNTRGRGRPRTSWCTPSMRCVHRPARATRPGPRRRGGGRACGWTPRSRRGRAGRARSSRRRRARRAAPRRSARRRPRTDPGSRSGRARGAPAARRRSRRAAGRPPARRARRGRSGRWRSSVVSMREAETTGARLHLGRVVALVRAADELTGESECGDDLGRAGYEGNDAHARSLCRIRSARAVIATHDD